MPVLVFIGVFIAFFWLFYRKAAFDAEGHRDGRLTFLGACIGMASVIALTSEGLSLLHAIRFPFVMGIWLVILAGMLFWLGRLGLLRIDIRALWSSLEGLHFSLWDWLSLGSMAVIGLILLAVALLAPPNTNDALQYHMSRVMHWIQAGSLQPYSTPISRQIWMPPWAEMAVMQTVVLWGSDRLANLVQWACMLGSLVGVSLIARDLGADRSGQVFAALFAATIPMGILQATSAQTDYATAFWLVCAACFVVRAHRRKLTGLEWLLLCLSTGLGVLTKGTFAIFALPLLAWLAVTSIRKGGWGYALRYAGLGLAVVLLLNAGVWSRNLQVYHFPLGPADEVSSLANQKIGWQVVVSNLVRNISLHLGTPYGVINGPVRTGIERFGQWIGADVNDPATSLDAYRFKWFLQEDRAGNPFHLLLVPVVLIWFTAAAWKEKTKPVSTTHASIAGYFPAIGMIGLLLAGFVLFSAVYKWQSTGSRLMLPLFVVVAGPIGMAFSGKQMLIWRSALALLLVVASARHVVGNPSRALIPLTDGSASLFQESRQELLFANTPEEKAGYVGVVNAIQKSGCRRVGMVIDSHDAEYIYWALLNSKQQGIMMEHIGNILPPLEQYQPAGFQPCAIICTTCQQKQYNGLDLATNFASRFYIYLAH